MKKIQLKALEAKYEEANDDSYWGCELTEKKEEEYAHCIGMFLIRFSDLEDDLDKELVRLVDIDESFQYSGYIIIKDLEISKKIELFYNLLFPMIIFLEKNKNQRIKQLFYIREQLEHLNTLRNKIAHAKWNTLDKEGYVRLDIKIKRDDGLIRFKKFKITQGIIKRGIKRMENLIEKINAFTEDVWSQ
jgi:hypothetical protein